MEVGVATYSGVEGAEHAFADARDRDPEAGWTGQSAFVEIHRRGRLVVRGSVAGHYVDLDEQGDFMGHDTATGAVVGPILGFALAPQMVAVALVGGLTVGGLVEAHHLRKLQGPWFDDIRAQLPERSSAVVVFSDGDQVRAMRDALVGTADKLVHYPLSPEAEAELRSALEQAPEAQPPSAPAA